MRPSGMRALVTSLALVTGAALTTSAPLRAQDELHSHLELTGFTGLYLAGTIYSAPSAAAKRVKLSDALTVGARLTYNFSPSFGLEASFSHTTPDLSAVDTTLLSGEPKPLGSLKIDQLDLDAVFSYASKREALYFAVGGGPAVLDPTLTDITGAKRETKLAFNAAVGYKRYLTDFFGVRIDARYRGIKTNRSEGTSIFCDALGVCYAYKASVFSVGELTAGLMVGF